MQSVTRPLCLASSSPRRRDILTGLGLNFSVLSPSVDERLLPDEDPLSHVGRLAESKASAGQKQLDTAEVLVLGADTIVVARGEVLGKPADADDARRMLSLLSGTWHEVHTAVALKAGAQVQQALVTSRVRMAVLTAADIDAYWQSGEPAGKAGAYAIQGLGGMFVERLEGSYSAVMGLPVCETVQLLSTWGLGPRQILENKKS